MRRYPFRSKRWMAYAAILVLWLIIVVVASCGGGNDSSTTPLPETPSPGTGTVVLTGRIF